MAAVFLRVRRIARSWEPVLVLGETGVGKEGIARGLHRESARAKRPFVALNCGALQPGTATSELLGHERGAFTSADRCHAGIFERARGGTVLLDEVGDLDAVVQAQLLRVLETRSVRRIGGDAEVPCDFRLVCATHRNLAADVARGRFRRDLFYRIGVIVVRIPPLRNRRADIEALADRFLAESAPDLRFSAAARRLLIHHDWPGNVRELKNVVSRVVVDAEGEVVDVDEVARILGDAPSDRLPASEKDQDLRQFPIPVGGRSLREIREDVIRFEVRRQRGNVTEAARVLGVARSTIYQVLGSALRAGCLSGMGGRRLS